MPFMVLPLHEEMKNIKVCVEDWSSGDGETIQKNHRFR